MHQENIPIAIMALDASPRQGSSYPAPFASCVADREKRLLGNVFGLTNFGVNLTRLAPGASSALRHYHEKQDEFLYILTGSPILITDRGETVLEPGMCAGFKAGVGNGHHLVNRSNEEVLYLEIGDRTPGDFVIYPDEDLQAVMNEDGKWEFQHRDGQPY